MSAGGVVPLWLTQEELRIMYRRMVEHRQEYRLKIDEIQANGKPTTYDMHRFKEEYDKSSVILEKIEGMLK